MSEIRFYRAAGEYGFLSNLYLMGAGFWLPDELGPDGEIFRVSKYFRDSESAYQYGKPAKQDVADWIVSAPKPHLCAIAAHGLFSWDIRPDWATAKVPRMRMVLKHKFDRCAQWTLAEKLLNTGDAELIEESKTDAFWGIGKKGTGKNMLGVLLMERRAELVKEIEEHRKAVAIA
jgi:ribA/ribD-fused uncharacterized protein